MSRFRGPNTSPVNVACDGHGFHTRIKPGIKIAVRAAVVGFYSYSSSSLESPPASELESVAPDGHDVRVGVGISLRPDRGRVATGSLHAHIVTRIANLVPPTILT